MKPIANDPLPERDAIILYFDGDLYFDALVKAIDGAQSTIELESYIFYNDETGNRIIDALINAADRGVIVRIIVDGFGSSNFENDFNSLLKKHKIKFKVYHPLPWKRLYSNKRRVLRLFRRINNRNHRKIVIIDNVKSFVGSRNICDEHSSLNKTGKAWKDVSVYIEGPESEILKFAFERVWSPVGARLLFRKFYSDLRNDRISTSIRLNLTYRNRRANFRDLIRRILAAEKRVWIENAYFVPHPLLLAALSKAAKKGVDVRIIVPQISDVFFLPWVTRLFHKTLITSGARVYEYTASFLHSKTALIDNWSIVGSSNLNHRSLFHDLECDIILTDEESLQEMKENYTRNTAGSVEICLDINGPGIFENIVGRIIALFKNWL